MSRMKPRPRFRQSGWMNSKLPRKGVWKHGFATLLFIHTNPFWMTRLSVLLTPPRITGVGARKIYRTGWGMGAFEYRQAQEIRDSFQRHGIRYLFIGKSGAILLG